MIRKIKEDETDLIEPLLIQFGKESDNVVPPNYVDKVKSSIIEAKAFVYGAFTDNNNMNGFGIFGNVSKRFSLVYAQGNSDLEIQLVDTLFNNHSADNPHVGAVGPWITETIANRFVELGFRKIDRATMTLNRKPIVALEIPKLSNGLKLEVFNISQIDEVSQLMFKANGGHIDQVAFPSFFGSVEACKHLTENIMNNVYGVYKKPYSWLLQEKGKVIGACFMTIIDKGEAGSIPDIVIDPEYQGKGLGKLLLIHSMKEILAGEPDMMKVNLDVTLENKARFLYKSVGYVTVREYSVYTWINSQ